MIVSVAVGWQMYDLTRDPLDLGLVGIVQFLPSLVLVLVTGVVADRLRPPADHGAGLLLEAICALALLALTLRASATAADLAVLAMFGVARAFFGPASPRCSPLVPSEDFANAIAWNSSAWQTATIDGPVAARLLYGVSAEVAYGTAAALILAAGVLISPSRGQRSAARPTSRRCRPCLPVSVTSGAKRSCLAPSRSICSPCFCPALRRCCRSTRATSCSSPLGPRPAALGTQRRRHPASPSGWPAHPLRNHAGMIMLCSAASFGAFTVLFGLSTITWLSIVALVCLGATDMFSSTPGDLDPAVDAPDHVRGRVNAVNQVFVGASNELGEFRAGRWRR